MKERFVLLISLPLATLAPVSCGDSDSSSSALDNGGSLPPDFDLTGTCSGTSASSVLGVTTAFGVEVVQQESALTGEIDIPTIGMSKRPMKGSLHASSIRFGDVDGEIEFQGRVKGGAGSTTLQLEGTYAYPSYGDRGTWEATCSPERDAGASGSGGAGGGMGGGGSGGMECVCEPGTQVQCVCADGSPGMATCAPDCEGFLPCGACMGSGGTGGGTAGAGGSGGSGGGGSGGVDAGPPPVCQVTGAFPAVEGLDVAVVDDLAFVADGSEGLLVVDVSNPITPVAKASLKLVGSAVGIGVEGNHAYVVDNAMGLQVVDVTDPAAPVLRGSVDVNTDGIETRVSVASGVVFATGMSISVVDATDPSSPVLLGTCDNQLTWPSAIDVRDGFGYTVDANGFHVLNLSNPAACLSISSLGQMSWPQDLAMMDSHAVVADISNVDFVDVTDPFAPKLVRSISLYSSAIAAQGGYVYVAEGTALTVMDASDPLDPQVVGSCDIGTSPERIVVRGDFAFVVGAGKLVMVRLFP